MSSVIAVSVDGIARQFGYGKGVGHELLIAPDMMGDPLATGGTIDTLCGKSLTVARLEEKFATGGGCKSCTKHTTDALLDAARSVWIDMVEGREPRDADANADGGKGDAPDVAEAVQEELPVPDAPRAVRKALPVPNAERKEVSSVGVPDVDVSAEDREHADGIKARFRETRTETSGSAFVTVKGKCAREVEKDGVVTLLAIAGNHKIAPIDGTETATPDGIDMGVCPFCHREVKLSAKGFVGAHHPEKLSKAPGLTERSVTDVVADAGERRRAAEIRAEQKEAKKEERAFRAPMAPNAGASSGDQGTEATRGAALVQGRNMPPVQPKSGHASTWDGGIGAARPDLTITEGPAKAGGRYGKLTLEQVGRMSKTQRRNYWRAVARRRDAAELARRVESAKKIATGEAIPSAERRERRKAARVGSSVQGHVTERKATVGRGATAEESQAALI